MAHLPSDKPFPRGVLLERMTRAASLRPLARTALDARFAEAVPATADLDLAAQDAFLDTLGLLAVEQLAHPLLRAHYLGAVKFLLRAWSALPQVVVPRDPWWGRHVGAPAKMPNATDPRALVRILRGGDWAGRALLSVLSQSPLAQAPEHLPAAFFSGGDFLNPWWHLQPPAAPEDGSPMPPFDPHRDWSGDALLEAPGPRDETNRPLRRAVDPGGVTLPPGHPDTVPALLVLDPRHATPDLPLRVGTSPADLKALRALLRDQGALPASVAMALAVGLDLAARRARPRTAVHFSPAWIHSRMLSEGDGRTTLSDGIRVISDALPCAEGVHPFGASEQELWAVRPGERAWITPEREDSSAALTARHGAPVIKPLPAGDVAEIKLHLAAGWVVVVSTTTTAEMTSAGFQRHGLALTPLVGQHRKPSGHAWLLVGYDHCDGRSDWRWNGFFLTLCPWGRAFPADPCLSSGVALLPFTAVQGEALEAFALRLHD